MSRRSSRRPRRRSGEFWKYAAAAALLILAVSIAGTLLYAYATAQHPPKLDKVTYCPDGGPRAATVILLDATDALSPVTLKEVRTRLLDIAEALEPYSLLEIRALDPSSSRGRTVFSRCNPGDGSNLDEFRGNPALARKRWQEAFRKPLERALQAGLDPIVARASPLMGAIQDIALERFSGKANEQYPRTLIIVSDMMEHSPEYTQYSGDLTFDRYKRSPAFSRFRTDLQGAEVTLLFVPRRTARSINAVDHINFWREWIRDNRGQFKEAFRLQGVS
jgi:hypothetical protein